MSCISLRIQIQVHLGHHSHDSFHCLWFQMILIIITVQHLFEIIMGREIEILRSSEDTRQVNKSTLTSCDRHGRIRPMLHHRCSFITIRRWCLWTIDILQCIGRTDRRSAQYLRSNSVDGRNDCCLSIFIWSRSMRIRTTKQKTCTLTLSTHNQSIGSGQSRQPKKNSKTLRTNKWIYSSTTANFNTKVTRRRVDTDSIVRLRLTPTLFQ